MNDPIINTDTEIRSPQMLQEEEIPEDKSFSYDGYQVVRGEFFAHIFEPSVTLNREKVSVNVACLRKLPGTEYVQFLVNPTEKKLAVKPSSEEIKDSFRWCSGEGKNRKPKTITCRIFFGKVMSLMNWNPEYRYKILGKLIRTTSLDELPQLFNVFIGDMSLIGPRPLVPRYLELYSKEQMRRHEVRPGITGWAQVNGRNSITWTKKFELDVWYVDHVSLWLDIKIIWKTIMNVIQRKDIDSGGGKVGAVGFDGTN